MKSLRTIIEKTGSQLKNDNWEILVNKVRHIMSSCAPKQLFDAENIEKDFEKNVDELMKKEDLMMKNFSFKLNSYEC